MTRTLIAAISSFALVSGAQAAVTPLAVKDANGATQNLGMTTDGTNEIYLNSVCGNNTLFALGSVCQYQVIVTSAGEMLVKVNNTLNAVTPADGAANTSGTPTWSENAWFNGTTWDRAPGDATYGGKMNVRAFPSNLTPTDCSGTIVTGGTAQTLIAANSNLHGFVVANIDATTGSGEPLWFSFTGTAAAATAGSYPLAAPTATTYAGLNSWTSPAGFGTNGAVSIIGATTGHKFSCTRW